MKTAIITGASRGIGRAIARSLAELGCDLFLTGRNEEELYKTRELILSQPGAKTDNKIVIYPRDLTELESIDNLFVAFEKSFNNLDILVNNAGIAYSRVFGEYNIDDWNRVMNINARAPFFLMQKAVPFLEKADPGFIINICSVVSQKGYAEQSLYTASKHALYGITKAVAKDLQNKNIRVHAILPGGVDTDMVKAVRPDIDTSEMITPEEIAETITFLLKMNGNAVIDEISIRRKTKLPWA
ncbi:MAG: SDR family NAD(P)-dependent oxidoreductase [Spirochaetales bacterium]|nr:SDR family NAD(P)-dependent oxidoreductase [Spirochaetales bacterium]